MNTVKSAISGFDKREYRNALGSFATGVCLITAKDPQGRARAMTANSFTSVSLAPPIILWCIDCMSERFDLFTSAEKFSVSVLRSGEEAVSRHFAKNVDADLTGEDLAISASGTPYYSKALAWMDCETGWRQKAGDHVVIFGNVLEFGAHAGDALGFFKGGYATVSDGKD